MPVAPGTYDYYLAPMVWDMTKDPAMPHWRIPTGAIDGIDLRPNPARALPVVAEGFSFCAFDPAADVPLGSLYLGNDLNGTLTDQQRRDAEEMLELSPGDFTLAGMLDNQWRVITDLADPTGENRVKPLMPTVAGNLELHLDGHSVIRSERFDKVRHTWVIEMVQRYMGDRAAVNPRTMAHLRRKYGFTPREILGIRGGATLTESFNTADADILGPDLTWNEDSGDWDIVSNQAQAQATAADNLANHTDTLDTDDHYAQVDTVSGIAGTVGTNVRYTDDRDYYLGLYRVSNQWEIFEKVGNTFSQLGGDLSSNGAPASTIKFSADGSTLELFRDGTSQGTRTDTSFTGQVITGIRQGSGSSGWTVDDFEAADLAAAAAPIRRNFGLLGVGR